jgi:hypothetical protein
VDEWQLAGRDPEYLLSGSRLTEFETWRQEGSLQLTRNELEFLDASAEHREAEHTADEARRTETLRLDRSARRRLVGLAAAGIAAVGLGGTVLYGIVTAPLPPPAPVAYAGVGPSSRCRQSWFDRAVSEFAWWTKAPVPDGAAGSTAVQQPGLDGVPDAGLSGPRRNGPS